MKGGDNHEWIRGKFRYRGPVVLVKYRSNEDRFEGIQRGAEMMELKKHEKEALQRIKESLAEFPDNRMVQYVTAEDVKTLIKLIEKSAK